MRLVAPAMSAQRAFQLPMLSTSTRALTVSPPRAGAVSKARRSGVGLMRSAAVVVVVAVVVGGGIIGVAAVCPERWDTNPSSG